MREIEVWKSLESQSKEWTYADFHRVEAWNKAGFPDINGCYKGSELWIEAKAATQTGKVKFRQFQIPWMDRRRRSGGQVFIAVVDQSEFHTLYIFDGVDGMDLDEHGIYHIPPLFMFSHPWNWKEILDFLTHYTLPVLGG